MSKKITKAFPAFILALALVMGTVLMWSAPAVASESFVGEIKMFAGNFAPRNYAFCDGQLLAVSQNNALFSLLGTIYGGDGRTTFGLPDIRGRLVMHAGSGPGLTNRGLGAKGGAEAELLIATNLPSHSHPVILKAYSGRGNSDSPVGTVWAKKNRDKYYSTGAPDVEMRSGAIQLTVGDTGGSQSFNHMPPFTVVNYIMALYGVYPSRN